MKLNNTDFTEVDIEMLTQIIPNLTFLDLSFSKMKKDQLTSLFLTIKNAANLQELDLTGIDLRSFHMQDLKESFFNIRKVSLEKNYLDKMSEVCFVRECKLILDIFSTI